jgi:hypothetical protein
VTNVVPAAPGCGSLHLATSDGVLYWADRGHGTIRSQGLASCAATTIVSGESNPTLLTTDGATLAWVTSSATPSMTAAGYPVTSTTATLRALALPGAPPRDLVTETNTTGGIRGLVLSADGQTLYYSADTRVRAVPVAGGAAIDVGLEGWGIPTALARDGDMVAFVTELGDNNVDAITLQDGVVASCGKPDANGDLSMTNCRRSRGCNPGEFQDGLILRNERVFWANENDIMGSALDAPQVSKETIASDDDSGYGVSGLVGGPDFLYFATGESFAAGDASDGVVLRSPYAADSTAVAIARGQSTPSSLVVAGSKLYWATSDCAINSVPR